MPPKKETKKKEMTKGAKEVMKFYETGLQSGMSFEPMLPPVGFSSDRMNPIVPLPMNPYPTSPFLGVSTSSLAPQ